ncbi:MAG: MamI family restriction endonuclease [Cyanobacteria bacterium]|nr:MamI family restriction endonuclease [Cyanobacteria bacterium CG_2015-16_32_12]NCO77603.1 MamI family restriction endonuclease [Cyanobacteria bacterium CG_2015-22_32_23]NCQ41895.1 MamI family restriction endonuclease [Cyanobacteria bacterium CG_2015-04_32_10]NCS83449.1 MamI family restriction endonuclease [Cyanobacteria bacterium CG_2015-02_32_10]
MQPDINLITIKDNKVLIKKLLEELVLEPRINALKWSEVTHQTPNLRIGYPGQHLASLITGIKGRKTGARGDDLEDGTEVKSCSRIDQMDSCKDCKSPVARIEIKCSSCGSSNIERKDDSKWLFTIRSENDLKVLTQDVERIFLLLADYPNFAQQDYDTLRFQSFEIWTNSIRQEKFQEIMTNYYYNIYLQNKKNNPDDTPAPQNFWPYQYQFYLCNPILTFACTITEASTKPEVTIDHYIEPHINRKNIPSILMPLNILQKKEKKLIKDYLQIKKYEDLPESIDEEMRNKLSLRPPRKRNISKKQYNRASQKNKNIRE